VYAGLPSDAWCEFVALLPSERRAPGLRSPVVLSCRLDGWPALSALLRLNQQGYGIHYGLTAKATRPPRWRRSTESDARWLAVLWADIDIGETLTRQQAFQAIQEFSPCPTAVIDSGGGYQVLWRIEPTEITDANRQHLRNILRGLALALRGDVACAELSRLFRLPGTLNTKPMRHWSECRLVDILPWVHPLSAFERYAELGAPPPAPPLPSLPDGARLALPGWVQRYLQEGRPEGRRNRTLFGAAIEYRANGFSQAEAERDLIPRGLADGLTEREIRTTIRSAFRSALGTPNVAPHIRARLRRPGRER
jgi:hypothetical protein